MYVAIVYHNTMSHTQVKAQRSVRAELYEPNCTYSAPLLR